jgi:hypothetical protein
MLSCFGAAETGLAGCGSPAAFDGFSAFSVLSTWSVFSFSGSIVVLSDTLTMGFGESHKVTSKADPRPET